MENPRLVIDTTCKNLGIKALNGGVRMVPDIRVQRGQVLASYYGSEDSFGGDVLSRKSFLSREAERIESLVVRKESGEDFALDVRKEVLQKITGLIGDDELFGTIKNCNHLVHHILGREEEGACFMRLKSIEQLWNHVPVPNKKVKALPAETPLVLTEGKQFQSFVHMVLCLGSGMCIEKTGSNQAAQESRQPVPPLVISFVSDVIRSWDPKRLFRLEKK